MTASVSSGASSAALLCDDAVLADESAVPSVVEVASAPSASNKQKRKEASAPVNAQPPPAARPARKPRVMKPLPEPLQDFSFCDLDKVFCALTSVQLEQNSAPEECNIAQYIEVDGTRFNLNVKKDLNLDQIRKLSRQLGCKGTHSASHVKCQKAIATLKSFVDKSREGGLDFNMVEARCLNSLLKTINVVFSSAFFDRFEKVNAAKKRIDHESNNMYSDFWKDAADEYNLTEFDEDDDEKYTLVIGNEDCPMNDDLRQLLEDPMINLHSVDPITDKVMIQRINTLFKIRRLMKKNMTVSGTHSNRPLDFVDRAMNDTRAGKLFHRIGVYYFYCRCEAHGDTLDAAFKPYMDDDLKGDTDDSVDDNDVVSAKKPRKKAEEMAASVKEIALNSSKLNSEMVRAREVMEEQYNTMNANMGKVNQEMRRVNDAIILKMKLDAALRVNDEERVNGFMRMMMDA